MKTIEKDSERVIVLGFGRSGTTWVSDIISKSTGRLVLFEPFHPSVTKLSREFSYSCITNAEKLTLLERFLQGVMEKQHRKMWLLRNHVPVRLDNISGEFLSIVWDNCKVIGFKEIRANFMISWLHDCFRPKIVYVIRHPCAVVASILRRTNFWEFGWPGTYDLFLERTVYSKAYDGFWTQRCMTLIEKAAGKVEQYAIMWAVTHAITLPELRRLGLPVFFYEDFYSSPFSATRELLDYLGYFAVDIHPASIFTPSMTTLKTHHGLHDKEVTFYDRGASVFWEGTLSEGEVEQIINIVEAFGISVYHKDGFPVKEGPRLVPSAYHEPRNGSGASLHPCR